MKRINTTHFAILGLLRIKPMSAYELVKFSKESIGLFWNESYGHIHKSLQQLEREGAVSLLEETTTGRQKKVYGITTEGCGQLDAWLTQAPEEPVMRNELLMKLFVSDDRHLPNMIAYLEEERTAGKQMLDLLGGIKTMVTSVDNPQARLWLLTLDYGERYVRMTIEWCEHALDVLNGPDRGRVDHDES
ncbi:PadR family transcriptional regulator [Paenibacillus xanthanilyticus]|uniref:PadR family transcriptional regulator n=1 Tax=Paenibacillus xanthanilyticus TaxID=1783531 RepID=A0ABV8K5R9_9BACL